jgi:hypothetical protein
MADRRDDATHVGEDIASGQGSDRDGIPAEDLAQLASIQGAVDQSAVVPSEGVDRLGSVTDTGIYQGDLESRAVNDDRPDDPDAANLELLIEDELRDGETHDAGEAAEEGLTWVPPVDPPIVVGDDGQADVGAGFGVTADDEPFDADHHRSLELDGDERTARVREALLAHAATTGLVDRLTVDTDGSRVIVDGTVDDLDDEDEVLGVISEVEGITDVVSRIRVESVG